MAPFPGPAARIWMRHSNPDESMKPMKPMKATPGQREWRHTDELV
jgi:hypothetical protein